MKALDLFRTVAFAAALPVIGCASDGYDELTLEDDTDLSEAQIVAPGGLPQGSFVAKVRSALDNDCLIFGNNGHATNPQRFHWGSNNANCGLTSQAQLESNRQAVWKFVPLSTGEYVITNSANGREMCLIFAGNGGARFPQRHLWGNGSTATHCGFASEAELIRNKQAVFKVGSLGNGKFTISNTSAGAPHCLIFGSNGGSRVPERYLWTNSNPDICGFPGRDAFLNNKQGVWNIEPFEDAATAAARIAAERRAAEAAAAAAAAAAAEAAAAAALAATYTALGDVSACARETANPYDNIIASNGGCMVGEIRANETDNHIVQIQALAQGASVRVVKTGGGSLRCQDGTRSPNECIFSGGFYGNVAVELASSPSAYVLRASIVAPPPPPPPVVTGCSYSEPEGGDTSSSGGRRNLGNCEELRTIGRAITITGRVSWSNPGAGIAEDVSDGIDFTIPSEYSPNSRGYEISVSGPASMINVETPRAMNCWSAGATRVTHQGTSCNFGGAGNVGHTYRVGISPTQSTNNRYTITIVRRY